jgi:tetratricopeptide (TPR) repeat protein
MKTIARILAIALCSLTALAQGGVDHLRLKDGKVLTGRAESYDEVMQLVTFVTADGQKLLLHADDLDSRSAYLIAKSRVQAGNAQHELKMANFARDIGLYAHAARHYRQAVGADPSLAAEVEVQSARNRNLAADWCLSSAKAAVQAGQPAEAEKYLRAMLDRLPDEPQTQEARTMLDELHASNRAARSRPVEEASPDLLTGDLKRGKEAYDRMVALDREALTRSSSSSSAMRSWKSAIDQGERALREIDRVQKGAQDPGTLELLKRYRQVVQDQIIEIHLNMASSLSTRSSFQQAMSEVNKALAIDSGNAEALAMRARVMDASSQSGRIWW